MQPVVAVACDVRELERYRWHAAPEPYLRAALAVAGAVPVLVPAFGEDIDIARLLARFDGVMLTGSKTNVHPERYGIAPTARHEPFDVDRDATALALVRGALAAGMPLFAICRGFQELNVALGGSIATEIQELEGRADHRAPQSESQDERFRLAHEVTPVPGGALAQVIGESPVRVNSLHRQGIGRLAPGLTVEATAEDGTIEAVSVADARAFALGVQWHPEYWAASDAPSRKLFEAFGAAVRDFAGGLRSAAQ